MVSFEAIIKKFDKQGEKTGWTYIDIPEATAQQLMPGNKKAFRIKGNMDDCSFAGIRDRKSTRLNSSHPRLSRMPSSA